MHYFLTFIAGLVVFIAGAISTSCGYAFGVVVGLLTMAISFGCIATLFHIFNKQFREEDKAYQMYLKDSDREQK